MAPTSSMLQDLNIIEHPSPSSSDSQDLIPPFASDLAAQLDLWSSVDFASDEPLIQDRVLQDPLSSERDVKRLDDDADEADLKPTSNGLPIESSPFLSSSKDDAPMLENHHDPSSHLYSLHHFLTGLSSNDAFQPPPTNFESIFSSIPNNHTFIIDPALAALSNSDPSASSTTPSTPSPSPHQPAAKRSRKSSTSAYTATPTTSNATTSGKSGSGSNNNNHTTTSATAAKPNLTTPPTPAEDKRRRNTAASARFRAKKKERELAMDRHAKELEDRVQNIERECESLRRENGWLRGLIAGVAGGVGVGVGNGIGSATGAAAPTTITATTATTSSTAGGAAE